jgi:hypothetical protein
MKMVDSSLLPVTNIWHTLSDFITHFNIEGHKELILRKMSEVQIKLDKMLKE